MALEEHSSISVQLPSFKVKPSSQDCCFLVVEVEVVVEAEKKKVEIN